MSPIPYHLVGAEDGDQTLTVFLPGESPIPISGDHPNFQEILEESQAEDPDVQAIQDLADPSITVANHLTPLSERVKVYGGHVYFDGDEVKSAITDHIVRLMDEGAAWGENGWKALVAFLENLANNPVEHSQHRLYGWLAARDFTISEDGCILAYKGVNRDSYGVLRSSHSGPGIVNNVAVNERLDNTPGNVVEIERSYVQHSPSVGCSTGLHAGTFDYANSFGSVVVLVKIDPRDVVSVPTDCGDQKVRVCRYEVVKVVSEQLTTSVAFASEYGLGD
jgi:hypothetical protein